MSSIYGGFYNPFGSLPYGYDPNSQSSVISTGGLWGDDNTVWNLNDKMLVQNLPETRSLMGSILQSNNGYYTTATMGAGSFYDNILQQNNATLAMLKSNSGSSGNNMSQMIQTIMFMKQMDMVYKAEKKRNAPEAKEKVFARDEMNDFIKNKNDNSVLKYGTFESFASNNFGKLKNSDGEGPSVKEVYASLGIDANDLSDSAKDKLAKEYGITWSNNPSKDLDKVAATESFYKDTLKKLGFKSDANAISKEYFNQQRSKLISGKAESSDEKSSGDADDKIDDLKTLIGKENLSSKDADELKEKIEEIAKDKTALKKLLESNIAGPKGTRNSLASLFTTLNAADDNKSVDNYNELLSILRKGARKHDLKSEWAEALTGAKGEQGKMDASIGRWGSSEKEALRKKLDNAAL